MEAAHTPAFHRSHGLGAGAPAAAHTTRCSPRVWSTSRRRRTEAPLPQSGRALCRPGSGRGSTHCPGPLLADAAGGPEARGRGAATSLVVPPRLQQVGLMPAALAVHRAKSSSEGRGWYLDISARPRPRRPREEAGRVSGIRLNCACMSLPLLREDGCGAAAHAAVPHPRGV